MIADNLVTMANEIAAFFGAEDPEKAAEGVANHLLRYWDPRMRKQIVEYGNTSGVGLSPIAKAAVQLLARGLTI